AEVFAELLDDVIERRVVALPVVMRSSAEVNFGELAAIVLRERQRTDRRIENREDRHAFLHNRSAAYARHGRHASGLPPALRRIRSPSGNASGSPRRIAM